MTGKRTVTPQIRAKRRVKIKMAREMRRSMTPPEVIIWNMLRRDRALGLLAWRRQAPKFGYILDFYCPCAHLALEVDGRHHNEPAQRRYDAERDRQLAERGIRTIRVPARAVFDTPEHVADWAREQAHLDAGGFAAQGA